MDFATVLALLMISADITSTSACQKPEDCNLNGECVNQICNCDPWWSGDRCSALKFKPASTKFAYKQRHGANGSSWGGSIAKDDTGMYHMFVSEWINNCGIAYWTPNSRIVRATSFNLTGPFIIQQEVLPTFWTNPQLVRADDENRTWLLYTDGMDCNRVVDCRNTSKPLPHRLPTCLPHRHMENGISLFSSPSLLGPWKAHGRILNGSARTNFPNHSNPVPWDYDTTNPAPLILANGSVLLVYRGCEDGCKGKEMIGVATAPHWSGPYTRAQLPTTAQMRQQAQEDPFVFQDPRGNFHMLTHTMQRGDSVGLHAWSRDGRNWTMATPKTAYTKTVLWADGSNTTFAERERPVLVFDQNGHPTHLINGVRLRQSPPPLSSSRLGGGSFPNAPTYTIVVPLVTA